MANQNKSLLIEYLNKIKNLHLDSIQLENDYVMQNLLNNDVISFQMKGSKPLGTSADGKMHTLDLDHSFQNVSEIFKTFGEIPGKEHHHPAAYFMNLIQYCKSNDITFEGYNKHTGGQIPLSLDDIYDTMQNQTIDTTYPGVPDRLKDMATKNRYDDYGVDLLIKEYNQKNKQKPSSEQEQPLYHTETQAFRNRLESDFYNDKVNAWKSLHQGAVQNTVSSKTGMDKVFATKTSDVYEQTEPVHKVKSGRFDKKYANSKYGTNFEESEAAREYEFR